MPVAFWGVAPIAPVHLGFDSIIPALRGARRKGWPLTVLLADTHLCLSHGISSEEARQRALYYRAYLERHCGISATYVLGSDLHQRPVYMQALIAAAANISVSRAKGSLPSRVSSKAGPAPLAVSSLMYPVMQCLDGVVAGARVIIADQGQRKIYSLLSAMPPLDQSGNMKASRAAPRLFTVANGVDIEGKPLRDSSSKTRISIHETEGSLAEKVHRMYAPPGGQPLVPGRKNALLWHVKYCMAPWLKEATTLHLSGGAKLLFMDFDSFEDAYNRGQIHPRDCKPVLVEALWRRIQHARSQVGDELGSWVKK
ncbi:MAG: hypothetical protein R3F15_01980 [Lysobacterales bacterium]